MSVVKSKCSYCRSKLTSETTSRCNDKVTCIKCSGNEAKYGKPGTCVYCCLPAAFRNNKCVYCSHSERKNGAPVSCSNCKLKAAFIDLTDKSGRKLCRLCSMSYTNSFDAAKESKLKKRKRKLSQGSKPQTESVASKFKSSSMFENNVEEQIVVVTQLKDQVSALQKQLISKDALVFERDKKIAFLNAQLLTQDKEHRKKQQDIVKQNQDSQESLQKRIHSLSRQVAALSKGKRVAGFDSDSPSIN